MGIKYILFSISIILLSVIVARGKEESIALNPLTSFYDLNSLLINGDAVSMSEYRGKKILIVNVASKCGLTPQYKELEELSQKFSKELIVLGFPSNDFLRQEPGSNEEISNFCSRNYSITFPLFEKSKVKGSKKNQIYDWLTDPKKNGWNKKGPSWNFTKYLIDENGKLLKRFSPRTSPLSDEIISSID
tara:strand:- start:2778 stop:3344 length:567 start_codon:yes stop_codon:yes gene_type:complete